jgi:calcineurin-like phosphoesterase
MVRTTVRLVYGRKTGVTRVTVGNNTTLVRPQQSAIEHHPPLARPANVVQKGAGGCERYE